MINNILENGKFIAEVITSISAAFILLINLLKLCKPIIKKVKNTLPDFFKGYTDIDGKKIRFFKGLKKIKERNNIIIKAIAPDMEMEDVLVLNKNALLDIISNSGVFYTIHHRKK